MGAKSNWGTLEGPATFFSAPLLLRIVFSLRTLCLTWAQVLVLSATLRKKEKGEMAFTEHLLCARALADSDSTA